MYVHVSLRLRLRVEVWRKVSKINVLVFFFIFACVSRGCVGWVGLGGKREDHSLHHHPQIWAWSFDDILENMMVRSVPKCSNWI